MFDIDGKRFQAGKCSFSLKKKKLEICNGSPQKIQYHIAAAGSIRHIGSGYCSIDLPF